MITITSLTEIPKIKKIGNSNYLLLKHGFYNSQLHLDIQKLKREQISYIILDFELIIGVNFDRRVDALYIKIS